MSMGVRTHGGTRVSHGNYHFFGAVFFGHNKTCLLFVCLFVLHMLWEINLEIVKNLVVSTE